MFARRLVIAFAACAWLGAGQAWAAEAAPAIAAASDLATALPQVVAAFQRKTGQGVKLTFGSSGNFTQQIQNGAPFEVFFSADEAYVETLAKAGRTDGAGALYAIGRLGLFVPLGSPVQPDARMKGLAAALKAGQVQTFAIANPEHAPYGRAAQECLQHAGVWEALKSHLVLGENVSQATQFAVAGGAQGGLIPLSLALTPQVKAAGTFVLLPTACHKPLRQRGVVIKGAGPTARAFYAFMQGREARAILTRYGFTLPPAGR